MKKEWQTTKIIPLCFENKCFYIYIFNINLICKMFLKTLDPWYKNKKQIY